MNNFDSIGQDLVGMCVNDVLCHGAIPIAFLDYYVTGQLNANRAAQIIMSIANACIDCQCALVGKLYY
jgi:phosphoribosylaminoimidazole (AIR) synthetase